MQLPPNHPERFMLAEEAHARPPELLETPSRASYVAVLMDPDDRDRERAHLGALCELFGAPPPPSGATHYAVQVGDLRVKWERHGEFSGYTLFATGRSVSPFDSPPASALPPDWLSAIPGATVVAAHAELVPGDEALWGPDFSNDYFNGNIVVGAEIGDGAGRVYTDFKIHDDGYSRFVVLDQGLTPRQAGRTLQRLFEIEAYRIMALLALPIARRQSPRIVAIEKSLASLTDAIAQEGGDDEALLHELTRLAAEVERALAASQFRFGACRAYFELVVTRIGELRETRLPGVQTIQEFMARRFTPAVATCSTTSQRLHDLSERVAQASALLSTRVSIARERQNQSVLTSMDRRAKQQLRLQQTVEGLSLAAIVYYLAGLAFYVAKGLKAGGLHFEPDLAVGVAIPLIAVAVFMGLRRVRRKLGRD